MQGKPDSHFDLQTDTAMMIRSRSDGVCYLMHSDMSVPVAIYDTRTSDKIRNPTGSAAHRVRV